MNKERVKKVAFNSKIKLDDEELDKFTEEFEDVLDMFSKIDEVDTEDVEPAFHPIELKNAMREDKQEETLDRNEALNLTINKKNGFYKGPKIK